MRILSLVLPTLATDRLRPLHGSAASPLVTVAKIKGAQRIDATDRHAGERGIRSGMGLADARAVCPALQAVEADPRGEAETLGRLLAWSRRFTPLAALDAPDGLLLDVSGVAHLFGGEAALIASLEAGLATLGFAAQAAIAETREAAWALARFGEQRIAGGAIRALADPLPLAALRLEAATLDALAQAGLRRVGDLVIRPRAPLAARFGETLFARLDGLLGLVRHPITPTLPVPPFLVERRTMAGLTRVEAIERAIGRLAEALCDQLSRAGQGARRLEASFFRVDGVVKQIRVGTSRPSRDAAGLARLFHEKLESLGEDGLDTGYGFDLIRLAAATVEPLGATQEKLDPTRGEAAREADFAELIDRLGARLGVSRVLRLHDGDGHQPEDAAVAVPAVLREPAEAVEDPDLVRPLRLFDHPEPIAATATVPDGPPYQFRWRRAVHDIAAIEGPERIAAPWWTESAPIRDYFQAEDGQGHRFWLFREGLYQAEKQPRWFVHGLFG